MKVAVGVGVAKKKGFDFRNTESCPCYSVVKLLARHHKEITLFSL